MKRTLLLLLILSGIVPVSSAAVLIDTDITTTTWSLRDAEGNLRGPYIVPENRNILAGHTLTIEPGVEVVLGPGVRLSAVGNILANGTPSSPIRFSAVTPGVDEQRWDRIALVNPNDESSQFRHCKFSDGVVGVAILLDGVTNVARTPILDCTFRNLSVSGVSAFVRGSRSCPSCSQRVLEPRLWAKIRRCTFSDSGQGIRIHIASSNHDANCGCNQANRRFRDYFGYGFPFIANNIFHNLTYGVELRVSAPGGSSTAWIRNNTFSECETAVIAPPPWDAEIRNNIFAGCAVAIERSGDLSKTVTHNCFAGNAEDFRGYTSNYGNVIWSNSRGIASDLFSNIFEDPDFLDQEGFMLSPSSPCVDSGCAESDCPIEAYNDICVPPSRGTSVSDIGAYGGPGACEMIPPVSVATEFLRADANFDLTTDISDAATILNFLFIDNSAGTSCAKAMDADDNSYLEITDAVFILRYRFIGGTAPPAPFLACGADPTPDPLPCESAPSCP